LLAAERISRALFSGELSDLTIGDFEQLRQDGLPSTTINRAEIQIVDALVETGLATSNRAAREFVASNAVSGNGEKIISPEHLLRTEKAVFGKYFILKRGKKLFHLICFQSG
jgi:tyrosyl-tRNA synthetase